jgi:MFS family permease
MGAREDVVSSFRLAVTDEARLFGGGLAALVGYALWVGLSGAALTFGADALNVSLSPTPWSGLKTGLVAAAWLVVPAAVGAWLLVGHLTNASGNLAQRYRYRHPAALLVPPVVLLLAAAVASLALAGPPWPLFAALVFGGLFLVVRVVAYGYRVFSLSTPRALGVLAGLSLLPVAVGLLTGGAVIAGRQAYLVDVLDGFGGAVGAPGLTWVAEGSVTVAGASLPAAVVAATTGPVGLSVAYLALQTVASLVARVRNPEVSRGELRTGQRYPDFARPTAGGTSATVGQPAATAGSGADDPASPDSSDDAGSGASNTPVPETSDSADAEPEAEGEGDDAAVQEGPTVDTGATQGSDLDDSVSNTRVYTPPGGDDADDDPLSLEEDDETPVIDFEEPAVDAQESGECPSCGEDNDPDAAFCTTCGEALE